MNDIDDGFLSAIEHTARRYYQLPITWVPACAGTTTFVTFSSMGGPQAHGLHDHARYAGFWMGPPGVQPKIWDIPSSKGEGFVSDNLLLKRRDPLFARYEPHGAQKAGGGHPRRGDLAIGAPADAQRIRQSFPVRLR